MNKIFTRPEEYELGISLNVNTEPRASAHAFGGHPTGCFPSTSHLPTDLQAVQPEARHTATMEAIDFANFDAAVSTQC